jgi:hypothetical protein
MEQWRCIDVFLTAALDRGEWLASVLDRCTPVERACSDRRAGGRVVSGADVDAVRRQLKPCSTVFSSHSEGDTDREVAKNGSTTHGTPRIL